MYTNNTPNYCNTSIDIYDIWSYEFNAMKETGQTVIYDKLLKHIEPIIYSSSQPFLRSEETPNSSDLKYITDYETRYQNRSTAYFRSEGDYYFYEQHIIVPLTEDRSEQFYYLFALKMRQYRDYLLGLDNFLYYQLKTNFKKDKTFFMYFIKTILIDFSELLGDAYARKIDLWEQSFKESYYDKKQDQDQDQDLYADAEGWKKIPIFSSDQQIMRYFSFLYQEKTDNGRPLLARADFEQLFRMGFSIPPFPLKHKLKLNLTPKYRKSILETTVFYCFNNFAQNQKNKLIFQKFLAYHFEDFSQYQTDEELKKWGKNFCAGKLNKKDIPFDLKRYEDLAKTP